MFNTLFEKFKCEIGSGASTVMGMSCRLDHDSSGATQCAHFHERMAVVWTSLTTDRRNRNFDERRLNGANDIHGRHIEFQGRQEKEEEGYKEEESRIKTQVES